MINFIPLEEEENDEPGERKAQITFTEDEGAALSSLLWSKVDVSEFLSKEQVTSILSKLRFAAWMED